MAQTLAQLCIRLARSVGEAHDVTPTGTYSTTGFAAAALSAYEDDYFNDWFGHCYAGTNIDTDVEVTDFTTGTGVFVITPAITLIDAEDLFYFLPDFRPTELIWAINEAISMVQGEALEDKVDATLETAASTYEYTIPTGFAYVEEIFQERGTADEYSVSDGKVDRMHWRILHGSTPKLWFDPGLWTFTAGRNLRLVGQSEPSLLTGDADDCNVNAAFIVQQAKALLHQSRIRGKGADFEEHESQMRLAQAMANDLREDLFVAGRGEKVAN